jgi:hypothetical protein
MCPLSNLLQDLFILLTQSRGNGSLFHQQDVSYRRLPRHSPPASSDDLVHLLPCDNVDLLVHIAVPVMT